MERFWSLCLKGLVIGGTLTVPGVSGGTMAMVLGVYEKLLTSLNAIVCGKDIKREGRFLLVFSLGAALGMLSFSRLASELMRAFPMEMKFLFVGAVSGSIPAFYRESGSKRNGWGDLCFLLMGVAIAGAISLIPRDLFSLSSQNWMLQLSGGFIAAIALVLPGISVSHFLYILGIYESLFGALSRFEILRILPFLIGLTIGVIAMSKCAEYLFSRFRGQTYRVLFGFLVASVIQMLGEGRLIGFSFGCIITFLMGFAGAYLLYQKNNPDV